ncbi:uncharacterized protein LOC134762277 [Penaeus indicus]|uniref:uncharacterized protein LOC134762277 n=1 Tax=Penaeus indicus TaxID=29960 RepID=UPI00300DB0E7
MNPAVVGNRQSQENALESCNNALSSTTTLHPLTALGRQELCGANFNGKSPDIHLTARFRQIESHTFQPPTPQLHPTHSNPNPQPQSHPTPPTPQSHPTPLTPQSHPTPSTPNPTSHPTLLTPKSHPQPPTPQSHPTPHTPTPPQSPLEQPQPRKAPRDPQEPRLHKFQTS